MNFATMSFLEMVGLGFLIWLGLVVLIALFCWWYVHSAQIRAFAQTVSEILFPQDLDEYDPEWMDYEKWKELST